MQKAELWKSSAFFFTYGDTGPLPIIYDRCSIGLLFHIVYFKCDGLHVSAIHALPNRCKRCPYPDRGYTRIRVC